MPKLRKKSKASDAATRKGRRAARGSAPSFGSDNLIEMAMESQPATWAAHQIAAKRHPEIKTVGAAMNMIEAIVREAILMDRHQRALEEAHGVRRKAQNDQAHRSAPGGTVEREGNDGTTK